MRGGVADVVYGPAQSLGTDRDFQLVSHVGMDLVGPD